MEKFMCEICGKVFPHSGNLKRHRRNYHKLFDQKTKCYKCDLCNYSSIRSDSFKRHQFNKHKKLKKNPNKYHCVICSFKSSDNLQILQHFRLAHGIDMTYENLEFITVDDFEDWRLNLEKIEFIKFTIQYSFLTENGSKKFYFACFRDGFYKSKAKVRQEKLAGSNKINGHCPAKMDVEVLTNGHVYVNYQKVHIGHKNEIRRLRLTKMERQGLAENISLEIPFDEILNKVRTDIGNKHLKRMDLVSSKDLHNIVRDFNIFTKALGKSDCQNIDAWVSENKKIVKFYKRQGELSEKFPEVEENDFLIIIMDDTQHEILRKFSSHICIDSTYGLNSYNFELTTLMVLDDLHQGFPCAFMFSNIVNFQTLTAFYTIIKFVADKIVPKVFISDMADGFYNAWLNVMGPVEYQWYSTWNVHKAWKKNLVKIKGDRAKQLKTYKLLTAILEEPNENMLKKMLQNTIQQMKENPGTAEFNNYFEGQFAHNVENWAFCYRLNIGTNARHYERMHSVIKYLCQNGRKLKRLEMALPAIMKFLKEKEIERIIQLQNGKLSSKLAIIHKRHKTALALDKSVIVKVNESTWKLPLMSNAALREFYQVKKVDALCIDCEFRCADCGTCIHEYICTCDDSAISNNICKHIHLVNIIEKNLTAETDNDNEGDLLIDNIGVPEDVLIKEFQESTSKSLDQGIDLYDQDLQQQKDQLLEEFKITLSNVESIEELQRLKKKIEDATTMLT